MARRAKIVSNERRKKLARRYSKKRQELVKASKNMNLSDEERMDALLKLQSIPRNASPVRVRNRCELTGRSRAFLRKFRLSRIAFRELALKGMIPGITKSSW